MTAAGSEPSRLVALCARVAHHGLISAECRSLTGGVPDADGIADCESVASITRAAFVQTGVRVIADAVTFDDLVESVAATEFVADGFRIDVHDPSSRIDRTSRQIAVALADVMPFDPDLDHPRHRFFVVAGEGRLCFGEQVAFSDAGYRVHDSKPWTTSSSLDARFSRALVNLVPSARSILDPCCGAGSIVLEAAALGLDAVAVDWKPAMVGMTKENLAHFGYQAEVQLADSRDHEQRADAIVTDLPYGHAIDSDEGVVRSILARGATCAPTGVYVAPRPITEWLVDAGYENVKVTTVMKRRGFTRWIHAATSSASRER